MSTAKRYEGPIVVGMKCWFGHKNGEPDRVVDRYDPAKTYPVRYVESARDGGDYEETFRTRFAVIEPVDAPAEKRERGIAAGWAPLKPGDSGLCFRDGTFVTQHADGATGTKPAKWQFNNGATCACVACAPSMGVFAQPAPAKTCKPGCGVVTGPQFEAWGNSWAISHYPKPTDIRYCSADCRNAARAKPAEPKPATKYHTRTMDCVEGCNGHHIHPAKPAPAEKATVVIDEAAAWLPQVEFANFAENPSPYDRWAALQTGVAPGLEREQRAINVRGVRSIYLPPTESQGERLSRLVESGLRADVRLDETRFEAGLRGGGK